MTVTRLTQTVTKSNRKPDSQNSKYFLQLPLLRSVYGLTAPFTVCGSSKVHAAALTRPSYCRMNEEQQYGVPDPWRYSLVGVDAPCFRLKSERLVC